MCYKTGVNQPVRDVAFLDKLVKDIRAAAQPGDQEAEELCSMIERDLIDVFDIGALPSHLTCDSD